MSLDSLVIKRVPIWVKLFNVPLDLWTTKGLSFLASTLGIPLYMDAVTEEGSRVEFAKICIDMDTSSSFPESFDVLMPNGNVLTVNVEYKWKPMLCQNCQGYGHLVGTCPLNKREEQEPMRNEGKQPKAQQWKQVKRRNVDDFISMGRHAPSKEEVSIKVHVPRENSFAVLNDLINEEAHGDEMHGKRRIDMEDEMAGEVNHSSNPKVDKHDGNPLQKELTSLNSFIAIDDSAERMEGSLIVKNTFSSANEVVCSKDKMHTKIQRGDESIPSEDSSFASRDTHEMNSSEELVENNRRAYRIMEEKEKRDGDEGRTRVNLLGGPKRGHQSSVEESSESVNSYVGTPIANYGNTSENDMESPAFVHFGNLRNVDEMEGMENKMNKGDKEGKNNLLSRSQRRKLAKRAKGRGVADLSI